LIAEKLKIVLVWGREWLALLMVLKEIEESGGRGQAQ